MTKIFKKNVSVVSALLVVGAMAFSSISSACDIHGQTGFLPENNMRIPVGLKTMGGLNETQFNQVMDKMQSLYSGVVAARGATFIIDRRWTDATVNAFAEEPTPTQFVIHMFGGLARHPEITTDAMALVACHELGHHLGGAPRKSDGNGQVLWASNEGQADYWGTMKCLRHYFEGDDNQAAIRALVVPTIVSQKCNAQYANSEEQAVCIRTSVAGLALGKLLNNLSKDGTVNFATPDKSVVATTFDAHPKSQCRLDTFFQASLCDHGYNQTVSNSDANVGVCSLSNGDQVGNRPTCWYKDPASR